GVDDGGHPEALAADLRNAVTERRAVAHARQPVAAAHQVLDAQEPAPERAAGVEDREVVGREAALLEERHRQRVAEGHRRRRAGGRREAERAGLLGYAHVERDVRRAGERRGGRAAAGGERDAEALREGEQAEDLPGLAAVRRGDQHVAGREYAQIAVTALAAVQEERGGPGAGQRRRDLARHDAGLAHAGDDDLAAARQQHVERAIERRPEALAHRGDAGPLDVEHAPGPALALG